MRAVVDNTKEIKDSQLRVENNHMVHLEKQMDWNMKMMIILIVLAVMAGGNLAYQFIMTLI
jgi:hypothetical protein